MQATCLYESVPVWEYAVLTPRQPLNTDIYGLCFYETKYAPYIMRWLHEY